ncbi:uncharacterized protein LOC116209631 [Punica granatum]|uniref:Uncharacterized protein LOC116209631 n=1 Tax=Punica granatum TaxID=22663 RepID=A0A6P8DTG7_PUNGR|nr:uncharacterized protein LOC116209631 [Punica granatum]
MFIDPYMKEPHLRVQCESGLAQMPAIGVRNRLTLPHWFLGHLAHPCVSRSILDIENERSDSSSLKSQEAETIFWKDRGPRGLETTPFPTAKHISFHLFFLFPFWLCIFLGWVLRKKQGETERMERRGNGRNFQRSSKKLRACPRKPDSTVIFPPPTSVFFLGAEETETIPLEGSTHRVIFLRGPPWDR